MTFSISVDTAAAVRALTERTRPSLAFDSVRVVRRALALGAKRVDVTCEADKFTVTWRGAPAQTAEMELIAGILGSAGDSERASALLELEEQHSLALLAILATAARAEVHGPAPFAAARGVQKRAPAPSSTPAVIVWREADVKDEREKLASWCRHADAPVYVDGKRIDKPFPKEEGARLARIVRGPEGRAVVGLADDPKKSRVVIYSHGIYLGVTQRPRGSIPVVAHVSVKNFGAEDDAVAARRAVDVVMNAAESALVRGIASAFEDLSHGEKRAVREALLDTDGTAWTAALRALPLFDGVGEPFTLSLEKLAKAGAVPATVTPRGHLLGTPLLDVRTRNFLAKSLGDGVVRPAVPARRAFFARLLGSPRLALDAGVVLPTRP